MASFDQRTKDESMNQISSLPIVPPGKQTRTQGLPVQPKQADGKGSGDGQLADSTAADGWLKNPALAAAMGFTDDGTDARKGSVDTRRMNDCPGSNSDDKDDEKKKVTTQDDEQKNALPPTEAEFIQMLLSLKDVPNGPWQFRDSNPLRGLMDPESSSFLKDLSKNKGIKFDIETPTLFGGKTTIKLGKLTFPKPVKGDKPVTKVTQKKLGVGVGVLLHKKSGTQFQFNYRPEIKNSLYLIKLTIPVR